MLAIQDRQQTVGFIIDGAKVRGEWTGKVNEIEIQIDR